MKQLLLILSLAISISAAAQAQTVMIAGAVYPGVEGGCWMLDDVGTGTTYNLYGGGQDLYRPGVWASVLGYPREWYTFCMQGIPFEVVQYRVWWPPETCRIVPEAPTTIDPVTVSLGDDWGDSCIPNGSRVSIIGGAIYFDVTHDYPPGTFCLGVITPWSRAETVGPLAAGTYSVIATLYEWGVPIAGPTTACTFSVAEAPCPATFSYQDDFETDRAVEESWRSSPILAAPPSPDLIHLCGLLAYEPTQHGRGLGFYDGLEIYCPPYIAYAAVPLRTVDLGGSVRFDLEGWGPVSISGSRDGRHWTTLGTASGTGPSTPVSIPVQAGQPANFLSIEGSGSLWWGHPTIDNLALTLDYRWIGDSDCDNDVDLIDYIDFSACMRGSNVGLLPGCAVMDADADEDVDLRDFQTFQVNFSDTSPRIGGYSHSDCRHRSDTLTADYPDCGEDQVVLTPEPGSLHVLHQNATYNCCPDDIAVTLAVTGKVLRLTEHEMLTMPCFCLCCYDVEATVVDLAPGPYTVEFCWDDYETGGLTCHVEDVTVP